MASSPTSSSAHQTSHFAIHVTDLLADMGLNNARWKGRVLLDVAQLLLHFNLRILPEAANRWQLVV